MLSLCVFLPRLPKLPSQCYSNGRDYLDNLDSNKEIQLIVAKCCADVSVLTYIRVSRKKRDTKCPCWNHVSFKQHKLVILLWQRVEIYMAKMVLSKDLKVWGSIPNMVMCRCLAGQPCGKRVVMAGLTSYAHYTISHLCVPFTWKPYEHNI